MISGALPWPYADLRTTNGWRINGSRDSAAGPNRLESRGTSRHPRTLNPNDSAISSKMFVDSFSVSVSGLKNRFPAAYWPCGGRVSPVSRAKFLMKNLWGIEVMTPAPSPSRASDPTAPRWVILQRRFFAGARRQQGVQVMGELAWAHHR